MDIPWGDERRKKLITNVGLITSDGPHGPNVMAAEWTYQVSYSPGLIAISIGHLKATHENIRATKEFGVSIAATDQTVLASIAGGSTGKEVRKIAALQELGFGFWKAKRIKPMLVEGAAAQFECRLVEEIRLGDHTLFVGEVLEATADPAKEPLAYHQGRYGRVALDLPKPSPEERERFGMIVEKHRKQTTEKARSLAKG